jgi:beta-galactosidase GanA
MIPDARDWSPEATRLYHQSVPRELMAHLNDHKQTLVPEFLAVWEKTGFTPAGTWEEVFGPGVGTEEIFMAWHFARYTNRVAAAGKAEYPLPMFVNAALVRPGYPPGRYPSAGPLPHLTDIWRAGAPQIDFLAPDIYFPNFVEWCQKYHRSGNPLFIPEAVRESRSAANIFYAVGAHDAIGLSPFAIDYVNDAQGQSLRQSYELLDQLAPLILAHQGRGTMVGVVPNVPFDGALIPTNQTVELGDYTFHVTFERPAEPIDMPGLDPGQWLSGGVILQEDADEFLVAGTGLVVTFAPRGQNTAQEKVGITSIQEGRYTDGQWQLHRWLSGDESHQGRHLRIPSGQFGTQRIKLYLYR